MKSKYYNVKYTFSIGGCVRNSYEVIKAKDSNAAIERLLHKYGEGGSFEKFMVVSVAEANENEYSFRINAKSFMSYEDIEIVEIMQDIAEEQQGKECVINYDEWEHVCTEDVAFVSFMIVQAVRRFDVVILEYINDETGEIMQKTIQNIVG